MYNVTNDFWQGAVANSANEKGFWHAAPLGSVRPRPGAAPTGLAPLSPIPGYATGFDHYRSCLELSNCFVECAICYSNSFDQLINSWAWRRSDLANDECWNCCSNSYVYWSNASEKMCSRPQVLPFHQKMFHFILCHHLHKFFTYLECLQLWDKNHQRSRDGNRKFSEKSEHMHMS